MLFNHIQIELLIFIHPELHNKLFDYSGHCHSNKVIKELEEKRFVRNWGSNYWGPTVLSTYWWYISSMVLIIGRLDYW